jgi:rod shape-determining protein MreD
MKLTIHWFLVLSLCFILMLLPWPHLLSPILPPWCLFLLFYTVVGLRAHLAWLAILFVGLMLDVMQGTILGEHVLALTLSLWMTRLDPKLYYNPAIDRQMIWIGGVFLVYQVVMFVLNAILFTMLSWQFFIQICLSVMLSVILWPWIALLLDRTFKPNQLHIFQARANNY